MRILRHLASFAALALLGGSCFAQAPRAEIAFNSDWKFFRGDAEGASAAQFADGAWQPVALPHTWNAQDALPGNAMFRDRPGIASNSRRSRPGGGGAYSSASGPPAWRRRFT